jgi:hypothetical protein
MNESQCNILIQANAFIFLWFFIAGLILALIIQNFAVPVIQKLAYPYIDAYIDAYRARVSKRPLRALQSELNEPDVEQMHSWHISSHLAAVSQDYLNHVPDEIASIIREAKELHPEMASGANKRYMKTVNQND